MGERAVRVREAGEPDAAFTGDAIRRSVNGAPDVRLRGRINKAAKAT